MQNFQVNISTNNRKHLEIYNLAKYFHFIKKMSGLTKLFF